MNGEAIREAIKLNGGVVFEGDNYDLNIFGVRSRDTKPNSFNDLVGVMYRDAGGWVCFTFPATTDPGLYYRLEPMNVKGTAILVPGQYRGAYKLGTHKSYPALQQQRPLRVYRDADRDDELGFDDDTIEEGMFGINIHRASAKRTSVQVNKWSAGCQVIADPLHFDFLVELVRESARVHGNSFTYTLLDEEDLVELSDLF
jgi:hypothetical protein